MGRTLEVELLRPQAEMIEYDLKFGAARGGNRAGKSIGFAYWLLLKRIQVYPKAVHAVVGPDYNNLRRGFFPTICGVLDSLGWEAGKDYRYVESGVPKLFLMRLGPHVKLHSLSAKLLGRLKGTSIQTLLLEEPQEWDTADRSGKEIYDILITRLSHSQTSAKLYPDMQTQLRMSFNPPAEGSWLWELIEERWPKQGYKCWRMSVRDNWLLVDLDEYVGGLLDSLDARKIHSEVDGHWSTAGGNVYYAFDSKIHGHPPKGIPPVDAVSLDDPLLWWWDFNVSEMCSVIVQRWEQQKIVDRTATSGFVVPVPTWQQKVIRFLDEFALRDSSVPQVIEAFLRSKWFEIAKQIQDRTGGIAIEVGGDPAGGSRSQMADSRTAARRPYQLILEELRKAGLRVKQTNARVAPPIVDSVSDVNAQFRAGVEPNYRYGATVDLDRCKRLIFDFRNLGYKVPKTGKATGELDKKAGVVGDASDAARYLISRERQPRIEFSSTTAKKS